MLVCDEAHSTLVLQYTIGKLRKDVSQMIVEKQRAQTRLYDTKHAKPKNLRSWEHVLVRTIKTANDGKIRKLEPRYKGPFTITKVLDHDRYDIEDLPGSKRSKKAYTGICPSDKLKPFETVVSPCETASSGSDD